VRTRLDLWQAMHRSGWYLPPLGAAVTLSYMQAVRAGQVWCPRYEHVRMRCCLVPPPTKKIMDWVQEALRLQSHYHPQRPQKHGFGERKLPDKQWALHALATLEPHHRIFGKGYVREPAPLGDQPRPSEPMVDNADGLFDGLPPRKGKPAKRSILRNVRPSAEARLERLRARRAQLEAQMAALVYGLPQPVNAPGEGRQGAPFQGAGGPPRPEPGSRPQPQNRSFVREEAKEGANGPGVYAAPDRPGSARVEGDADMGGDTDDPDIVSDLDEDGKLRDMLLRQREAEDAQRHEAEHVEWLLQQAQTEEARQYEANVPYDPVAQYQNLGSYQSPERPSAADRAAKSKGSTGRDLGMTPNSSRLNSSLQELSLDKNRRRRAVDSPESSEHTAAGTKIKPRGV
jgi:hypothetical protein